MLSQVLRADGCRITGPRSEPKKKETVAHHSVSVLMSTSMDGARLCRTECDRRLDSRPHHHTPSHHGFSGKP